MATDTVVILDHFSGNFLIGEPPEKLASEKFEICKVYNVIRLEKDNDGRFDHPHGTKNHISPGNFLMRSGHDEKISVLLRFFYMNDQEPTNHYRLQDFVSMKPLKFRSVIASK